MKKALKSKFGCLLVSCILLILGGCRRGLLHEEFQTMSPETARTSFVNKLTNPKLAENLIQSIKFTTMKFGPAYVLGAALGNSSQKASWDIVKIYASITDAILGNTTISCCVRYSSRNGSTYFKLPVISKSQPLPNTKLTSYLYTCENGKHGSILNGVAITTEKRGCKEDHVTYVRPLLPQAQNQGTTLALVNKGAYGNVSAELIIEWMETYIYLGVDKVLTYFLKDLNINAKKVLSYYASTGILDLFQFEPALEDILQRVYHPSDQQSMSDRQMTVFDSFERLSGYTYVGIIDHDEFLIPSKNRSLKQLLADLNKKYQNAAGFTFYTQQYSLSWRSFGEENDLILGRYITRAASKPSSQAQKNIVQPKYIKNGGAHTHRPKPVEGMSMKNVQAKDGYIRHYRKCAHKKCETEWKRQNDTWMATWSKNIQKNVLRVRKTLFGTVHPVS